MNKRDVFRLLYGGRFIILIAAVLCAAVCCGLNANVKTVVLYGEPPEGDGEYIAEAENFAAYIDSAISEAKDEGDAAAFRNLKKYRLSTLFADILNTAAAKDTNALVKAYRARADRLRAKAENLNALAWQIKNNAETGSEADFAVRYEEYCSAAAEAQSCRFDAEYCENIISLMTDKNVSHSPDAEKIVQNDIAELRKEIDKIRLHTEAPPLAPETAAVLGFGIGALLCAALMLCVGGARLAFRLKKQKKAASASLMKGVMDDINFRG